MTILSDELLNDPLGRGYAGMTDQQAADDLNTKYRDKNANIGDIIDYLSKTRTQTNQGSDTVPLIILGRLALCAEQTTVPVDPFATAGTKKIDNVLELTSIKAFYSLLKLSASLNINMIDTEIQTMLNNCINGGVFNTAHRDALIAMSQNQITRVEELGLGRVRVGEVTAARV